MNAAARALRHAAPRAPAARPPPPLPPPPPRARRAAAARPAAAASSGEPGEGGADAVREEEEADAVAAAGSEEEEGDLMVDLPPAEHVRVADGFAPPLVAALRAHFLARFADPLAGDPGRFVWDYWHVPGQYTLLRTPAATFFPEDLHARLVDALAEHGERALGCRALSPLWLSLYVDGCAQELHTDAPHGPWALVLSLTDWEGRRFAGGETTLLRPETMASYWDRFDPGAGLEAPQLAQAIEPRLGRLAVFDGRLPHGVRRVEGERDPRRARVVVHGWYAPPTPFFSGALAEEEAAPALEAALAPLLAALGAAPPAVGAVVARLGVGADGRVAELEFLTNTLVPRPAGLGGGGAAEAVEDALALIADHLGAARFPPAGGPSAVTAPFVFE